MNLQDGIEQKVEEQITMAELKLLKMGEEITKEAERLRSFYTVCYHHYMVFLFQFRDLVYRNLKYFTLRCELAAA